MRVHLAAVLASLLWPAGLFAWEGRVVTIDGRPLVGATVSILGQRGEAITGPDGHFAWQPDPSPPFEILVVLADGTYMKPVLVERLATGERQLIVVEGLLSEAVTVSGSAPGIESTPAAGTTTLSGREVDLRQPANLVQAVENVAGVSQVSEGQAAVPAVRGLARGRTLIIIDGARVTSERRAGPGATFLDPSVIDGVDVARGPGSVAYGSDAFGGVIAVRTKRVAPGTPWAAHVTATAGTGLPDRRVSGRVSRGLPAGGVLLAVHARSADDWSSPRGVVLNSGFRDAGVLARVEHQVGPGYLSVGWQSDFGRDIERPRNNSDVVRFYYPFEDSHRFTASLEVPRFAGFERLNLTTFYGRSSQRTDQDRAATATTTRRVERGDVEAQDYGVRLFGERLLGRARLETGVDLNGRFGLEAIEDVITFTPAGDVASTRPFLSIENARRASSGVYASLDTALTPVLSIGAGVRGDHVGTRNDGGYFGDRSTSQAGGSGYLAVTAGSFGGVTLTAQVARGFRDPTLSDRYYRGPTGRGFITGNPDLDPESSLQFDGSVRFTGRRVRLAAYGYHYRIDDLVERYEDTPGTFFFRNRGRARLRGLELELQTDLGRGLSVDVAMDVSRGEAGDTGDPLDDVAPVTLMAVARQRVGDRGYVQARVARFARDDRPGPTEREVPSYTLLDAQAGWRISRALEIRLQTRNLLDQEYFASQDVRAVLAPGRAASLTAAVTF